MNLGAGDKNAPMDECYFFVVRSKVKDGDDGMNTSRSAGIGYWKISGTKKVVDESGKQLLGNLASLKYIIRREKKDLAPPKCPLKLKEEEEKTQENSSNGKKMKKDHWEEKEKIMHDEEKTNWVMQELTLGVVSNEGNRFQKLAICKIRHREVAERAMVDKHEEERRDDQKASDLSKSEVESPEICYQEEGHHVETKCADGPRAPTVSSTLNAKFLSQQNYDMLVNCHDASLFTNGLDSDLTSDGKLIDHIDNYINVSWTMDDRYKDLDDLLLYDSEGDQD